MNLKEQLLSEGIGERELHHYTDIDGLFGILKSQTINGLNYTSFKGDKGKNSVATVRPSMSNEKNLDALSGSSSGGVKFIIDGSKLSDLVRGVKLKPLAEYPLTDMNVIRSTLKPGKKLNPFLNSMFKLMKQKPSQEISNKISKLLSDNVKDGSEDTVRSLTKASLRDFIKREGEERIVLKKGSIPLNPKYIKIELDDKKNFKINSYRRKLLLDNKKYFVINDIYKKLTKEPENKTIKEFVEE